MSSSSPIVLLDDDETNDETALARFPQHETTASSAGEAEAIQLLLQIMPNHDRAAALQILQSVDYNVNQAVSCLLDEPPINPSNNKDEAPAQADRRNLNNKAETRNLTIPRASVLKLAPEWHQYCEQVRQTGEIFVDPDFPPTQSSLDGRKHTSQSTKTIPSCLCGLPAVSRSVQSDGPNYGRFYLACGQPRRRWRGPTNKEAGTTDPPPPKPCQFFQWDQQGSVGAASGASRFAHLGWHSFGPPSCVLYKKCISPSQVRQGSIGNCWFLSALAVVSEKDYLVQQLLPHAELNEYGCYQVNLCLDGKWTPVLVDSSLPVVYGDVQQHGAPTKKQKLRGGILVVPSQEKQRSHLVARPAFAAAPEGQLWPALVEKAYAKAHGSYAQLSGGFIAEALLDMTGAPTETIVFRHDAGVCDVDELWARMLSFSEAGFLMGVATSQGGEGLVGGHAYSVLDVKEFHDVLVGAQQKVTDFFKSGSPKKLTPAVKTKEKDNTSRSELMRDRKTIRLVRIRNPWGVREWKGDFSANSDKWTTALRKRLGDDTFAKGDGTFFMAFEDMIERFHHMDIAKTREGWRHVSLDGCFDAAAVDALSASHQFYRIRASQQSWAFISVVQPKKRANTKTQYWYGDISFLIIKRKSQNEDWTVETSAIHGCTRTCSCEVFLDPSFEYYCIPLSHHLSASSARTAPFRVTAYSSTPVELDAVASEIVDAAVILGLFQRVLLGVGHKLHYAVAKKGLLVCIHGQGCIYFVAINSATDHYLTLRLAVEEKKGLLIAGNKNYDIPPRSQKILTVVSSNGTGSGSANVSFSYAGDIVPVRPGKQHYSTVTRFHSPITVSMAGDLLASEVNPESPCKKGADTIETHRWLSQLGSSF